MPFPFIHSVNLKIVYYTSGLPGTGRIVQAMSIFNALNRKSVQCDFVIVSSTEQAKLAERFGIRHIEIPLEDETVLTRTNYSNSELFKTLTNLNPDILIVDRMWFSLHHFIQELDCKKIFFSIQVRDNFFSIQLPRETLRFDSSQYDRVLAIEPFESVVEMEMINPLLIRNREEIFDREKAVQMLGVSGRKPVCLIALNYKEGYFEKLKDKYSYMEDQGFEVIATTNIKGGGIFPIVDYYNAIDLVVCAAGYTQFWEVVHFNKDALFETFPMHFTDLQWRIDNCRQFHFEENGADQLVEIMLNM